MRLNAWLGLAKHDPESANRLFDALLADGGGDITADTAVGTAMRLGGEDIYPALVGALAHPNVSLPAKERLISHLGQWPGAAEALRALALDEAAPAQLREAARTALGL